MTIHLGRGGRQGLNLRRNVKTQHVLKKEESAEQNFPHEDSHLYFKVGEVGTFFIKILHQVYSIDKWTL